MAPSSRGFRDFSALSHNFDSRTMITVYFSVADRDPEARSSPGHVMSPGASPLARPGLTMAGNVDALFVFSCYCFRHSCARRSSPCLLIFSLSNRHRANVAGRQIEGSTMLELTLVDLLPGGIFLFIFAWGTFIFFQERTPPHHPRSTSLLNDGCGSCSTKKGTARLMNCTCRCRKLTSSW